MLRNATPWEDVEHFIYPLNEDSDFYFEDDRGKLYPTTPDNFRAVHVGGPNSSVWGVATGHHILRAGHWVWAYFGGKQREILGVGVVQGVAFRSDWSRFAVEIRWDEALTARLAEEPIAYATYEQRVQAAVVRANDSTKKVLFRWLRHQALEPANIERMADVTCLVRC